MTTVTTWTGWEANALRKALRMSVTAFAEHVGVARRTAATWSSQGHGIVLRAEMQAALDTVLARSAVDVRERFTQLRIGGTGPEDRQESGPEPTIGRTVPPGVSRLMDALIHGDAEPTAASGAPEPFSLRKLLTQVGGAKADYQACRYDSVLDRLLDLLPLVKAAGSSAVSDGDQRRFHILAAEAYHVAGSVLLKVGEPSFALVAAERSSRCGADSGDPVAIGASARILAHALMSNGHHRRATMLAQTASEVVDRRTGLITNDAKSVYGALLLRGAVAAARAGDRDTADTMLVESARVAARLGHDGNDRWTGFGPTNVLQHRAHLALALGDAGTAIAYARRVQPDKIALAERKAALYVDMAQAYTQWGRHGKALLALRDAQRIAPEEIRSRPSVQRIVSDLAVLSRGHLHAHVTEFAAAARIPL